MVEFDIGLKRTRDLVHDDIDEADFGDSGSAVDVSQTGVQSPIAAAQDLPITKTKGAFSFQSTAKVDSATATGNTFREISLGNGTTNYDRSVFPGVAHTANDEIVIIKTKTYQRG